MEPLKENRRKLTQPIKDLIIILILSIVVMMLVFIFHPFEKILKALLNREGMVESIWLVIFWLFAFIIFYFRRHKEFKEIGKSKILTESVLRAKADFIANMSHEVHTPLTSILGFSELLIDEYHGKINEKQKEYLNNIYTSGKHLLRILDDVLDLAKIESDNIKLEIEKLALKDALNDCITLIKERAIKNNIKLSLDILPEADIEIEADQLKFKRIILNLLSNAIKFTPGEGAVRITAKTNKKQDEIEVSVEDTGIGIKREDMSKLFKEFCQIESPYTKKHEGTGMGLAITKKLVELQGGKIWVESEFGKSTKVTFTIPFKQLKTN